MHILIIEDDAAVAASIADTLGAAGYSHGLCRTAADGLTALGVAGDDDDDDTGGGNTPYDAAILDINLPDSDGFRFTRTLRRLGQDIPILVVSGRVSVSDRVLALETGADGYLTKPFEGQELLAMLAAIIRRSHGHGESTIRTGPIALDLARHEVRVGEEAVNLTAKEYRILELLALDKGATLAKSHFLGHLYGAGEAVDAKIIDVFMCKLRRKLSDAAGGANYIHTVWGQGYVLRDEPSNNAEGNAQ